jgi:addiction module RelE/StbE family toxin
VEDFCEGSKSRVIRWTTEAAEDFRNIRDYIAADSSAAALRQCVLISKSIEQLDRFPRMGKAVLRGTIRRLSIANTQYVLFYQVKREIVVLLRIRHGAMETPSRFKK